MNNKEIERIALEVARDYLKFKLGDRKGFNVYDIDASDADELIAEIEKECGVSFMDFLAAVDTERGKDAAAYAVRNDFEGSHFEYIATWPEACHEHINDYYERVCADGDQPEKCTVVPLFLSPMIPEGMAQRSTVVEECALLCDALAAKAEDAARDGGLYSEDFASAYEFAATEIRKLVTGVTK